MLDSLLAEFRKSSGISAHFREEKTIALLAAPLVSSGSIDFAPPSKFARRVMAPSPSMVLLDGTALAFWDGKGVERIDLATHAMVRLYVDSFIHLLRGDRGALAASWSMDLELSGSSWEIALTPKAPALAKAIHELRIRGHGTVLEWMKLSETSGDETLTTFREVDTAHRYSEAELSTVFSLPRQ